MTNYGRCEDTVVAMGGLQACGRPLDENGYCDRAADHRDALPHDGTRLGKDLQRLEESDPIVKEAAIGLEEAMDRLRHPDDYVNPKNLQVDDD